MVYVFYLPTNIQALKEYEITPVCVPARTLLNVVLMCSPYTHRLAYWRQR